MKTLIYLEDAIDALMKRDKELRNINWYDKPYAEDECKGIDEALDIVSALPSAEPERKTGRWNVLDECSNVGVYCSNCRKKVFKLDFSNTMKWKNFKFCPNCGSYNGGTE